MPTPPSDLWTHFTPVFEAASDCMALLDAGSGVVLAANAALCRQLGTSSGDLHQKHLFELSAFENLARDEASFREFANHIASKAREAPLKKGRGEEVHFNIRGTAYESGGRQFLLLRFRPLKVDFQSGDSLMKSTMLARLVFENAADGINVREVSPDFSKKRVLACNERFVKMTGFSEAELLAMDDISCQVRSLQTPEEDAENERKLRALEPASGEASWIRPDGEDNAFEWRGVPIRVGEQILILGVDRDITQQRRAQEFLRQRTAELDALINNIPDMVWFKDTQSRYITVNAAFVKAVGRQLDELRGKNDFDTSPPELAKKYQEDDARVVREKIVLTVEEKHELKGRPTRWIVTTKSPILDKDGTVLGTVGIARDITERRQAELENAQQRARLEAILEKVPMEFLASHQADKIAGTTIQRAMEKRKANDKG